MMQTGAFAFLAGILLLHQCLVLPPAWWCYFLPLSLAGALLQGKRWLQLIAWLALGFLWAQVHAQLLLQQQLPAELFNKNVIVRGYVASLPEKQANRQRFEFDVTEVVEPALAHFPQKVRLSWYTKNPVALHPGDNWTFTVHLRPAHNFTNPGSFDYSAWLLQKGIIATGSIADKAANIYHGTEALRYPVQSLRYRLQVSLHTALHSVPGAGLIAALVIGDRSGVSETEWTVLQQTGTVHLMAISGLHIGLVAGFVFFLVSAVWRLLPRVSTWLPAPKAAALAAWLAALLYSALAGFAIPTQRALIMLAVILFSALLQRSYKPSQIIAAALVLVLLWDPFAVLSASFWLSFSAVALIYYFLTTKPLRTSRLSQWWQMQWAISLGMLPVVVLYFQQAPLSSPFANLLAIPWVSMLVLPVAMLSTLLAFISTALSTWGLQLAAGLMHALFVGLNWAADFKWSLYYLPAPTLPSLLLALLGILLLLLPRGIPARALGVLLCVPLCLPLVQRPAEGEVSFSLLDVGQGLAAVVQTARHTLVFDTGPRFSATFDTGDAVIVPFLRQQHVQVIDTLLVSHSDMDHIGGAQSLLSSMPVTRILSSVPALLRNGQDSVCVAGQEWTWDQVGFRVLYPSALELKEAAADNARSCVLQIHTATQQILLTGDIEQDAEQKLVDRFGEKLRSTVLVIPHHGSKTSSSPVFLDVVNPQIALIPAGWRNRFGFPAVSVLQRLRQRNLQIYNTAEQGAIQVTTSQPMEIRFFRQQSQRYWHTW